MTNRMSVLRILRAAVIGAIPTVFIAANLALLTL